MLIKIKRHHQNYTPGDITGFASDYAQRLIDAGIAVAYSPDAPANSGVPVAPVKPASKSTNPKG